MGLRLMGVDAGFGKLGWVVADADEGEVLGFDCIKTTKQSDKRGTRVADDDVRRCKLLRNGLLEAHREYEPRAWFVENPSGGSKSSRAARSMGMATALLVGLVEELGVPCEWLTYRQLKKEVEGKVSVTKEEVREAMLEEWTWPDTPEYEYAKSHVYDAAACLVAGRDSNTARTLRSALQAST